MLLSMQNKNVTARVNEDPSSSRTRSYVFSPAPAHTSSKHLDHVIRETTNTASLDDQGHPLHAIQPQMDSLVLKEQLFIITGGAEARQSAGSSRGKIGTTSRITAVVEHKYTDYAWEHLKPLSPPAALLMISDANPLNDTVPKFVRNDHHKNTTSGRQERLQPQKEREVHSLPNHNILCFPERLYEMLRETECDPYISTIVSWQPHGRSFLVHKPKDFVSVILLKYFRQSKLTSFQRQLNLYGFKRLTKAGKDKGAYYHELFLRGRPMLSRYIRRISFKGLGVKPAPSPETEPNFYAMSPCHESDTAIMPFNFLSGAASPPSTDVPGACSNKTNDHDGTSSSILLKKTLLECYGGVPDGPISIRGENDTSFAGNFGNSMATFPTSFCGSGNNNNNNTSQLCLTNKIVSIGAPHPPPLKQLEGEGCNVIMMHPQQEQRQQMTTEEILRALARKNIPTNLRNLLDCTCAKEEDQETGYSSSIAIDFEECVAGSHIPPHPPPQATTSSSRPKHHNDENAETDNDEDENEDEFENVPFVPVIDVVHAVLGGNAVEDLSDMEDDEEDDDEMMDYGVLRMLANGVHLL